MWIAFILNWAKAPRGTPYSSLGSSKSVSSCLLLRASSANLRPLASSAVRAVWVSRKPQAWRGSVGATFTKSQYFWRSPSTALKYAKSEPQVESSVCFFSGE